MNRLLENRKAQENLLWMIAIVIVVIAIGLLMIVIFRRMFQVG